MVLNVIAQFGFNFDRYLGVGGGVDPSHSLLIVKVRCRFLWKIERKLFENFVLEINYLNIFECFVTLILEVILVRDLIIII